MSKAGKINENRAKMRKYWKWKLIFLFGIFLASAFFACRKNVKNSFLQQTPVEKTVIAETKNIVKERHDFMIFGHIYPGDYGMSRVLGNAVDVFLQQGYLGDFLRSEKGHIERTILYDMLSRKEVMTILLFPKNFSLVLRLAKRYPQQAFALPYSFANPQNLPPNLRIATIRLEEGAFLAGVAAAKTTRNSRVGIITDLPERQSQIVIYAFVQGVFEIKPDAQIIVIRSNSEPNQLENHTTRIVSDGKSDVIFAMSMNYNDAIIRSAYDLNLNALLINSWYDASQNTISANVITSLVFSLEPIIGTFIRNATNLKDFSSLPQVQSYGLAEENTITFSWEGQEESVFERERPEYRKLSQEARREVAAYKERIRTDDFAVFNALNNGSPPAKLRDFRFLDLRQIHAIH